MPTKLEELRTTYPQYADRSDKELLDALYKKSGGGLERTEFNSQMGQDTIGQGASALQGLGQGATFGFADEASAGIRAGLEKYAAPAVYALGQTFDPTPGGEDRSFGENYSQFQEDYYGGDIGERYQENLESQRGELTRARRENPWTTGLAELGGGLLTGGAGGARAVAGQTLGKGALRGMGAGALMGGVGGYGYGEGDPLAALATEDLSTQEGRDVLSREAGQAAGSAGLGAALGGTLGGAVPFVGAGARKVAQLVTRPFTKKARINEQGRTAVMNALREDIDNGYITMDQARRELADTPGMTIADLGPATRELTETVANTPTPAGRMLREGLETRNKEQWKRIFPKLSEAIGAKDNFSAARRQLVSKMRQDADVLYGQAYQVPTRVTRRMRDILENTPSGKLAMREGKALQKELERRGEPIGKLGTMASTKNLDYIIQSYDDVVSQLYKAGKGKRGTAAKALRDELREIVYKQNPPYREARKAWAGDKANENAMDLGLRIFRDDADVTADVLRNMTGAEKTFFRIGTLRAIARKLGNKSDTSDITKGIFDRPNARDAIKIGFGSKAKFDEFMNFVGSEQKMFNTFKQAVGNSATARRLQQGTDPGGKLAALIGYTGSLSTGAGVPPSMGAYLARKAYETVVPAGRRAAREQGVRQSQANLLQGQDISKVMNERTLGGLLGSGAPVTPSAGVGGLLATGQPYQQEDYGR